MIYFLIYSFSTGLLLSIVFQLTHIVEFTDFPLPDESCQMEEEWIRHQMKTTANFAMKNRILCYLLGGLNFQIEHHLFPSISHIHYSDISPIVQEVCNKYGVPYYAFPDIGSALCSHYLKLKISGRKNN